ncbi:tailspike protein [Escherichia phage AV101]|nr:tailspike protein [Escherichia phage AV101]
MNEMFSQGGKGSTGILTNKQAVARHFGVKQSEVVYFSVGAVLSGYKVIYDKVSQRAYSLPADIGSGVTAVSLSPTGVLVHSAGNVDLGALAVTREEYVTLPGSFSTGVTVNTKNELVVFTDGKYRWDGVLPKVVPADTTPGSTGGEGLGAWISVGDASLRCDVNDMRNKVIGGNVYPLDISSVAQVGGTVPVGTSFVNTDSGIYRIKPEVSGVIGSISDQTMTIDSTIVYLEKIEDDVDTFISAWAAEGDDVSSLLYVLITHYKTVYIDINVTLSSNVISDLDNRRLIGRGGIITLVGSSFDQTKGAVELTGNYTEVSGIYFTTLSTEVTPLRMGNTAYGASDSSRRVGVRSNSCTFDNTGFKGPNHGNFVLIGALYPEITFPRFIGQPKAGGNMEVLGVKGGYVSEGYAENGLLINYHATSADGTGFPTTDFKFIDCEGVMNSSVLGSVDGAVGGNNNIKFSRGCTNCKIIGGKFTSISNGAFNGNDHVVALQGCSNNRIENVQIFMQNNGDFKSAYGFFDHQISLTDCLDNVISGGMVTINTPGQYNRICNVRSDFGKSVRRNRLENVTFNCYNGSNTVDAVLEQYSSTSGMVSDQQVTNCSGLGVSVVLRNRAGLASSAVTYLGMNRIGTVYDTYTLDSGVVKLVSSPCVVNINSSGALALAAGCTATKSSVGIWVINFPTDMSRAGYTFSSPGTGRYVVVNKTSTTSWTITTYSNAGVVSDMECSIVIQ